MPASLAAANHRLDRVEQVIGRGIGMAEFARRLQIDPGDLERILEELGE